MITEFEPATEEQIRKVAKTELAQRYLTALVGKTRKGRFLPDDRYGDLRWFPLVGLPPITQQVTRGGRPRTIRRTLAIRNDGDWIPAPNTEVEFTVEGVKTSRGTMLIARAADPMAAAERLISGEPEYRFRRRRFQPLSFMKSPDGRWRAIERCDFTSIVVFPIRDFEDLLEELLASDLNKPADQRLFIEESRRVRGQMSQVKVLREPIECRTVNFVRFRLAVPRNFSKSRLFARSILQAGDPRNPEKRALWERNLGRIGQLPVRDVGGVESVVHVSEWLGLGAEASSGATEVQIRTLYSTWSAEIGPVSHLGRSFSQSAVLGYLARAARFSRSLSTTEEAEETEPEIPEEDEE